MFKLILITIPARKGPRIIKDLMCIAAHQAFNKIMDLTRLDTAFIDKFADRLGQALPLQSRVPCLL